MMVRSKVNLSRSCRMNVKAVANHALPVPSLFYHGTPSEKDFRLSGILHRVAAVQPALAFILRNFCWFRRAFVSNLARGLNISWKQNR